MKKLTIICALALAACDARMHNTICPAVIYEVTASYIGDHPACRYAFKVGEISQPGMVLIDTCGKYKVGDTLILVKK